MKIHIFLILALTACEAKKADAPIVDRHTIPKQLILFPTSSVAKAYSESSVRADEAYKGQDFRLYGNAVDFGTDISGKPYVEVRSKDTYSENFYSMVFYFEKSDKGKIAEYNKGDGIDAKCTVTGNTLGLVTAKCNSPKKSRW